MRSIVWDLGGLRGLGFFCFRDNLGKIPFHRLRRNAPTRRRGEFDCSTSFRAQDDTQP